MIDDVVAKQEQSNNNNTRRKGGKKKPFIDRKHCTTFRLIHRSQRDPLVADNEIGEHVLQPVSNEELEERSKYGVYYTDNYNYLQHLKNVGEAVDLGEYESAIIAAPSQPQLPSVIFETKGVELKVGLLNQAAQSNELLPDVDPDIVAALDGEQFGADDDFFEDDFVTQLNAETSEGDFVDEPKITDEATGKSELMKRFGLTREKKLSESEDDDDYDSNQDPMDGDAVEDDALECRSRFTNYSMSSAVIKRPNGLQIIDEHFEAMYEQYDDDKCGAIEDESNVVGGFLDPDDERFQRLVNDYAGSKRKFVPEKPAEEMKQLVLKIVENNEGSVDEDADETESDDEDDERTKRMRWDCESILSTYSNKKHHPLLIKEENMEKNRRRGLKVDLKKIDDEEMDDTESVCTYATTTTVREKGEDPQMRRMRKAAVREQRRERRMEKKLNKLAFKEQKKEFDRQRSCVKINTRPIN